MAAITAAPPAAYDEPWKWLALGWSDLRAAPSASLAIGMVFAAASLAIILVTWLADAVWLLPAAVGGFLLVAPTLAVGLYEISRRVERGQPVSLALAFAGWRRNFDQIAFLAALLVIAFLMWMQFAFLLFMLAFGHSPPDPARLLDPSFLLGEALPFLLVGCAIGAVLAAFTFAVTAVSVPMLVHRDVGVAEAVRASVLAVWTNRMAMAVWASLIVILTIAGLLVFVVGLAVTMPLLGHATWHAYRALVPESADGGTQQPGGIQ